MPTLSQYVRDAKWNAWDRSKKSWLEVEKDDPPAAVGGIMEMEGQAPTLAAFRKFIKSRLPGMERFR